MRKSCKDGFPKTHRSTIRGWYHTLRNGHHNGPCYLGHGHPVDVFRCRIRPAIEDEVPLQHWLVGLFVSSWYVKVSAIILATSMLTMNFLGGVASATITLGAELESTFFRVVAEVLTAIIVLVWVICFARTVRGAFSGELFPKPGVCELRPDSGAKVRLLIALCYKTRSTKY
jgi:hypothetical protein